MLSKILNCKEIVLTKAQQKTVIGGRRSGGVDPVNEYEIDLDLDAVPSFL
ncbi:hypothetical protein [Aquimarina sp. 2304DJ70-9]